MREHYVCQRVYVCVNEIEKWKEGESEQERAWERDETQLTDTT